MLVSGEIDAALSAHPPSCFDHGHPNVVRLFPDYLDVEMKYVKDTGIYPIMHTIALKREIVERNPWVAANLFNAFEEAKRRSVERALAGTSSTLPLPWAYEFARRMQDMVGKDLCRTASRPTARRSTRSCNTRSSRASATAGCAGRVVPGVSAEKLQGVIVIPGRGRPGSDNMQRAYGFGKPAGMIAINPAR